MASGSESRETVQGCRATVREVLVTVLAVLTGEIVCRALRTVGLVTVRDDPVVVGRGRRLVRDVLG